MFFLLNGLLSKANDKIVQNAVGLERSFIGNILNVIRIAGTGIALIMLTWMSLNYFMTDRKKFAMGC